MRQSNHQSPMQWVPTWDAMKLLQLGKTTDKAFFNCVGDTLKGRRCGCEIARDNVKAGKQLLSQLPRRSVNSNLLEDDLKAIAYRLLCVRWHRDSQVDRMVKRWRPVVLAANAKSKIHVFQSHTRQAKPKPKPKDESGFTEREFKQEDVTYETQATEEPEASASDSDSDNEDDSPVDRPGRTASEQEDFLRREKQRCEEARRQSQRERAEQQEAKARAERERAKRQQEQEEAKRRREQASPPPRPQPRPTNNEDWDTAWTTYHQRWTLVAKLPSNATLADLEKVFPWPLRNIHQLGLCISKLDASFEKDVETFFRHLISQRRSGTTGGDDKKVVLKTLRQEALCWHPDKVLVRFPVSAVPMDLKELATKITQVLTRLMGIFRI